MTIYNIDLQAQQVRATGVVNPTAVWVLNEETQKWKSTDEQAKTDDGVLLWDVEIQFISKSFGKFQTQIATVQVPSPTAPTMPMGELAPLTNVQVMVQVKNGRLNERWSADSIATPNTRSNRNAEAA